MERVTVMLSAMAATFHIAVGMSSKKRCRDGDEIYCRKNAMNKTSHINTNCHELIVMANTTKRHQRIAPIHSANIGARGEANFRMQEGTRRANDHPQV